MSLLQVSVASTDRDLTTTSAFKSFAGLNTGTSADANLAGLIRAASVWAESYVGRPLTVQSYTELRPAYGRQRLMLTYTPIRAVPQLLDDPDTGSASAISTTEYTVEREAGFLRRPLGWAWTAPTEYNLEARPVSGQEQETWRIDYVSGYTYGGVDTGSANWSTAAGTTSTGRTLPEDIEQAVLYKADALRTGSDILESEQLGDLQAAYRSLGDDDGVAINIAEAILMPYRRVV